MSDRFRKWLQQEIAIINREQDNADNESEESYYFFDGRLEEAKRIYRAYCTMVSIEDESEEQS